MSSFVVEIILIAVSVCFIVITFAMAGRLAGHQITFMSEKFGKFSIDPVSFCLLLGLLLTGVAGWLLWQDQNLRQKELAAKTDAFQAAQQAAQTVKMEVENTLAQVKDLDLTLYLQFHSDAPDPADLDVISQATPAVGAPRTLQPSRPLVHNPENTQELILVLEALHAGETLTVSATHKKKHLTFRDTGPAIVGHAVMLMGEKE